MSIHHRVRQFEHKEALVMRLIVTKMVTEEDYNIIAKELKKHTGIKEIGPYTNNKLLKIIYYPNAFNIDIINYLIGKLGYRAALKQNNKLKSGATKKGG